MVLRLPRPPAQQNHEVPSQLVKADGNSDGSLYRAPRFTRSGPGSPFELAEQAEPGRRKNPNHEVSPLVALAAREPDRSLDEGPDAILPAAHTYYVSSKGNDSNPGTEGAPFLTIQKVSGMLQPGDTVLVQSGTYDAPYFAAASIVGTAKYPIVIAADPFAKPGSVVISGKNSGSDANKGFNLQPGCDYVHIIGFTITNSGREPNDPKNITKSGIFLRGTVGNKIANNTIDDIVNGSGGVVIENGSTIVISGNTIANITSEDGRSTRGHGVNISAEYGDSTDITVEDNVIEDNDYTGVQITSQGAHVVKRVSFRRNQIRRNGQNAINADGVQDSVFENNWFEGGAKHSRNGRAIKSRNGITPYRIDSGDGLAPEDKAKYGSKNNRFVNNTIVQSEGFALNVGDGDHGDGCTNNIAFNNLLIGGPAGATHGTYEQLLLHNNVTDPNSLTYDENHLPRALAGGVASFRGVSAPAAADGNYYIGAFSFPKKDALNR